MASARNASNKAKIARRVVEVLEFFDEAHPEATVMDIVRRYDRPQSSTSELLSSLVELGLLHKDPYSRSYRPTVRAALLGASAQGDAVRDGRLVRFLDRLVAQTSLPVLLFGKNGLECQIVSFRQGSRGVLRSAAEIHGGRKEALTQGAAGWLLLSTLDEAQRSGAIRRLNAEAAEAHKFSYPDMVRKVSDCAETRSSFGALGFGSEALVVASLLPGQPAEQPLVAGIAVERDHTGNPEPLLQCIRDAAASCLADPTPASVEKLLSAA